MSVPAVQRVRVAAVQALVTTATSSPQGHTMGKSTKYWQINPGICLQQDCYIIWGKCDKEFMNSTGLACCVGSVNMSPRLVNKQDAMLNHGYKSYTRSSDAPGQQVLPGRHSQ